LEFSAFEIALFTGILGVGATLLGIIISYWLSVRLIKKQVRMVAGAKLRAAFAPQMAEYTLMEREIGGSLWHSFLDHSAAVEEYRIFIPKNRQGEYKKAWECYYKPLTERAGLTGPYEDSKICMERIEGILKFTEPF